MTHLFQYTYLFNFKFLLHLLLLPTLRYELKLQNLMWLDLARIDILENSLLLLVGYINYCSRQYFRIVLYTNLKELKNDNIIMLALFNLTSLKVLESYKNVTVLTNSHLLYYANGALKLNVYM